MKRAAKVISVGALGEFKAALIKFGEQTKVALIEANADMQRTINRLQGELITHWQREEKLWTRKVAEAKSELYKAQLQSREERPSAVLERKALEAAQRKLEHAQQKIQRTRYWARVLEKEMLLCRGQLQQLDRVVDADLPRVAAQLDRMMQSLDEYLKVKPAKVEGEPGDGALREVASGGAPDDQERQVRADAPENGQDDVEETDRSPD